MFCVHQLSQDAQHVTMMDQNVPNAKATNSYSTRRNKNATVYQPISSTILSVNCAKTSLLAVNCATSKVRSVSSVSRSITSSTNPIKNAIAKTLTT